MSYKDKNWLEEQYVKNNLTCAEIAKLCDISSSRCIWKWLKKCDIPTRKSGQREGYKLPEESKKKISNALRGKSKSEDHKKKLSEARRGEKNPNFGKKAKIHGKRCWYTCPNGETVSMRSNWEVAYAKYLNSKNINWKYEPETFILPDGDAYTPDFLLETGEYIEVKGWLAETHKKKIDQFRLKYQDRILILADRKYLNNIGVDLQSDHCGIRPKYVCRMCEKEFYKKDKSQILCSKKCANRWILEGKKIEEKVKVKRPYKGCQTGGKNNATKLTEEIVALAIKMKKQGFMNKTICEQLNMTKGNLGNILKGVSWKHLPR